MTNREFYNAIVNGNVNDEVIAQAQAYLDKMDAANEKRRNTPSKKAIENQPILDTIVNEVLTSEPKTASDVAAEIEVSVQKASALLRALVADGKAVATDVKVPKKGTQKAYTLAE
jgi:predicted Rossmann fold nucleotide-binding protein DprA/Smf involved in DNA uptake